MSEGAAQPAQIDHSEEIKQLKVECFDLSIEARQHQQAVQDLAQLIQKREHRIMELMQAQNG